MADEGRGPSLVQLVFASDVRLDALWVHDEPKTSKIKRELTRKEMSVQNITLMRRCGTTRAGGRC
jgi:hypothetical protein